MSDLGILEILSAHLHREGLALCRNDGAALTATEAAAALRELATLASSAVTTPDLDEWSEIKTTEIPSDTIERLRNQALQAA